METLTRTVKSTSVRSPVCLSALDAVSILVWNALCKQNFTGLHVKYASHVTESDFVHQFDYVSQQIKKQGFGV